MRILDKKAKQFCSDPVLLSRQMSLRGVPGCSLTLIQAGEPVFPLPAA